MTEEERPCDPNDALEAWRQRMNADRAWLELAADQFQPHSQVSMNVWIQARQDLAQSTLFFESTYQQANARVA